MSDTWIRAIVLVCTFGAVLLAVEAIVSWYASTKSQGRAINLRLSMINQGRSRGDTLNTLRRNPNVFRADLPPVLASLARKFERLLTAAQITTPVTTLLLYLIAAPITLFVLATVTMVMSGIALGPGRVLLLASFCTVLGVMLPLTLLQVRATRTRRKMQEQFPVALDVFVRGLRAGHPIAAALDLLTVEMPDPIGSQFGIAVDEVTYGADLRDALQGMAERWDMEDMRMFVVSLAVQSETGGNLAEILENLSKVIRERASMMMKVRALSSEGRMTALMLTVLPIFAFVTLFLANPQFYLDVADDPAFIPGFGFLIVLYSIGFYTIRRMVDLKV